MTITTLNIARCAGLASLGLMLALAGDAATVAEQSGATLPASNGFVVAPGHDSGNAAVVTNDLGLGIGAVNINGTWCCSGFAYILSTADQTALASSNWLVTVDMREISTSTTTGGYGPNSLGSGISIGFDGMRFDINLHTDGKGNQILSADPFISGETYTIQGLGTNYAEIQMAYDAATKTVSYYVDGTEVLTNIPSFNNFYEPWFAFGGQDANFSLVELQSDTSITTENSPEPASIFLFGLGVVVFALILRYRGLATSFTTQRGLTR